jgi:hypothetical protein
MINPTCRFRSDHGDCTGAHGFNQKTVFYEESVRVPLIDMVSDPGETADLAGDPEHRDVLLEHREILTRFGREHNDPLVAELLAGNVKPIPFAPATGSALGETARWPSTWASR